MDPASVAGLILLVGIGVLILIGVPIAVALGVASILAAVALLGPDRAVLTVAQQDFAGINSFPLLAIPFFILAGGLMNNGGVARRLIDAATVLVGRLPGSLVQTNVVANAMFGSVSGSPVAATAAVGSVMMPIQREKGYDRAFSASVNIASAPSGMLIPPSNNFIIYSLVSSTSVGALFVAGYGPGILWALTCMVVVYLYVRKRPEFRSTERVGIGEALLTLWRAVPSMLMIIIVVGGILAGVFTPTESAAVAVVYSLILGFAYKGIKIRDLPKILLDATKITSIVMLLVAVSSGLSWVLSFARIPQLIADLMFGISSEPAILLIMMMVILLIVGTFMDPVPAILIFTPIFLPIVVEFGMDPIHFGVILVFNLCLGIITPPVGSVLFVGSRISRLPIEPVIRRLLPFFLALIVVLFLVVFVPQISMWLPSVFGLATLP